MEMKLLPASRERLQQTWLPYVREFELPPGEYQARLVLRDQNSDRLGSITHEFDVPELGSFRISTPVLSDIRETTPEGQPGDRLAILARREFPAQGLLYFQVDVYQAAKESTTGMPEVSLGYEVRRSDGTLLTGEPLDPITPTSLGVVSRLVGFPIEGTDPGAYELVLEIEDRISGETRELREPFHVSAPLQETAEAPAATASGPTAR
jgi:hypothetical protein